VNVQCAHLWPNVAVCLMLLHIFQVMALLHSLRTAIVEDYQQIPGTMTSFVFSALPVMVRPEHTMYDQINKFLLQRPSLDLSDVPMFYSLFNSPNAKDFKAERSWILQVILHAVAPTGLDLQLFRRRHVFAILMAFFDAPFADAFTCRLVIQILEKASLLHGVFTCSRGSLGSAVPEHSVCVEASCCLHHAPFNRGLSARKQYQGIR
jgi:hypothetical protein